MNKNYWQMTFPKVLNLRTFPTRKTIEIDFCLPPTFLHQTPIMAWFIFTMNQFVATSSDFPIATHFQGRKNIIKMSKVKYSFNDSLYC